MRGFGFSEEDFNNRGVVVNFSDRRISLSGVGNKMGLGIWLVVWLDFDWILIGCVYYWFGYGMEFELG